ncbi:phage holin family protein [Tropicibacter sp. S64]|uniref:phage holin family protein n=1 Tax=Tropicibacter sp. S64 TaxID=3415122 RepID=UPI003C7A7758
MMEPGRQPQDDIRALPDLLADLATQMRKLFVTEVKLAKAELSESARSAATGLGFVVAAALIALVAVQALVAAAVIGLAEAGLSWLAATLIVGGLLALAALILALLARSKLSSRALTPNRTVNQVRKDLTLTEEMTHG